MEVYIAGIVYGSMVDGDGVRTSIFFSGCSVGCKCCHNQMYWNKFTGKKYDVYNLFQEIKSYTPQKNYYYRG